MVPSASEDGLVVRDDGSDGRVGGGEADAALGLGEGGLHEGSVFRVERALVGCLHGISAGWGFRRGGERRWR